MFRIDQLAQIGYLGIVRENPVIRRTPTLTCADMAPPPRAPLTVYRDEPAPEWNSGELVDVRLLASRELLRPLDEKPGQRDLEPGTRNWYEELELRRYSRHGSWLSRALEFTRHPRQTMIMVGPGLGTDALQYLRHGTEVTICLTPDDHPEPLYQNLEWRALSIPMVHTGTTFTLPFARGAFDLAYWNAVHTPPGDIASTVDELYRVLKPGGKVFAMFPAHYDVGFWQKRLCPCSRYYSPSGELTNARKFSARELRRLFGKFEEHRTAKRHLRRADLPFLLRILPTTLLQRVMGQILVLRAFKPLSAIHEEPNPNPNAGFAA